MNREFVQYEQALALKELGFDKPCLARYMLDMVGDTIPFFRYNYENQARWVNHNSKEDYIWSAPLKQQAFNWIREKYTEITFTIDKQEKRYFYTIIVGRENLPSIIYQSELSYDELSGYEHTELACLKKLIEIIKENES